MFRLLEPLSQNICELVAVREPVVFSSEVSQPIQRFWEDVSVRLERNSAWLTKM